MEFKTRKVRDRTHLCIESEDLEALYPHNVLMYHLPPTQDITLELFEELATERLAVLRILEHASAKNLHVLSKDWKAAVLAELNLAGYKGYARLIDGHSSTSTAVTTREFDLAARRRDYISHFILRLVYCRSRDNRKWFMARELELFKLKFSHLMPPEIKRYLEIFRLDYQPISEEEKEDVKDGLNSTSGGAERVKISDFFRVHFTEVPDLVRTRRCYLKSGFAYVGSDDFVAIVAGLHEACIEKGLAFAARLLPEVENDERIADLLKGLHTSYVGKDYAVGTKDSVPIECIDQLSKKSFPLCMRHCHETLRTKHHLKHFGRLQYGLFLKGIGVTLDDAMRFWREEFTKMMDLDKFERSYAYNIRYNYGKEGRQQNWSPPSCMKVISDNAGPQDAHGCPFKALDANTLRAKLNSYGFSSAHAQEVASFASKGHYQIACAKYFEIMHETQLEDGINHPNQYFDKSQAIIDGRASEMATAGGVAKSQKLPPKHKNPNAAKDLVLKRPKQSLMDEYDDDLWNVTQQVELQEASKAATANWNKDDDDFNATMSQMDEDY